MPLARLALLLAVLTTTGAVGAEEPSLASVLERAAAYVREFQRQLSGIVAEETYVQEVKSSSTMFGSGRLPHRELKSDLLLIRPARTDRYVEFRDVFEVDGTPVRDRQERLTKLFLEPSAAAGQLQKIITESARYNIGNIQRNVNTPTLALIVLDPAFQPRFKFRRAASRTPAMAGATSQPAGAASPTFSVSTEMWVIEYREAQRKTMIRTPRGEDLPARGHLWIEPDTGRVLMTELVVDEPEVRATIDVSYQSEPLLGFLVPIEMRERYEARRERVEGRATYGRFRQFQVKVDEKIVIKD